MSENQPLLTYDIAGAAAAIGLKVRSVRHLVATRQIPFVRVGGTLRFRAADLAAWLDSNTEPSRDGAAR